MQESRADLHWLRKRIWQRQVSFVPNNHSIFSSGDIANTMPLEGQMFNQVDDRWRQTMDIIQQDSSIIALADVENIMIQFQQCNRNLEKI
jgi:hypothetical protein